MEDTYVSRVNYGEEAVKQDPFGYHQNGDSSNNSSYNADAQARPNWDAYSYYQDKSPTARNNSDMPPKWNVPPAADIQLPKTDVQLPATDSNNNKAREIRLPDGAVNRFDDQGRCTFTGSADGRKSREVKYEDQSDPNKITQVTIDQNRVYTRNADGRSWSLQVNGQQAGTWYGDVHMSKTGEYSIEDHRTGEQRKFASNTAELTQPRDNQNCPPGTDCSSGQAQYYRRPAQTEFCQPGQQCRPYYRQEVQQDHYRRAPQTEYCQPGQPCRPYYQQPVQYDQYGQPIQGTRGSYDQGQCYPQQRGNCYPQSYDRGYGNCSSYGGNGVGRAIVSGMVNGMIYRGMGYGGYGGYGGFYQRGYGYGGGNIGGAIIGNVIGRAIMGGGRHCRW